MHELAILRSIIRAVPQWYVCSQGDYEYSLRSGHEILKFCSHKPLTAKLYSLLEYAQERLPIWMEQTPEIPTPSSMTKIGEDLAIKWLELQDPEVNWNKWIAYAEEMRLRTHENITVERNLIISSGSGLEDITGASLQRIFDSLTAHSQVYLRVDKNLFFLDYDEVLWSEIKDSTDYKFSPEFIQPLMSIMGKDDYCAHLSARGDILMAASAGMLASCRKGQWFIYDVESLRDCIVEIIGDYHVGCHLFEILFDLSYRRRGALLIFDPDRQVVQQIVNKESIIDSNYGGLCDKPRYLLTSRIKSIHMSDTSHKQRKKRLFLEVAEVDGSLLFDTHQVIAFGAMIKFHPELGSFFGARTAAAQSALLWGGYVFKVSADGDIHILFKDKRNNTYMSLYFM